MKKIAVVCACLLGGLATGFAQEGKLVYENDYAKVSVFPGQTGFDMGGMSDDGRFFYGSSQNGSSFIYEIANNDFKMLDDINIGLLRVKDRNNYAATAYTMINGKPYLIDQEVRFSHEQMEVVAASGDLKTLFVYYCNTGATGGYRDFNTMRVDAESGKIIDTLAWRYPQMQTPGEMNKVFWASEDGKIAVGTSGAPFAFTNTVPVFWDLEADTVYYVGIGEDKDAGTTEGLMIAGNNDGSVLCGGIGDGKNDRAYIIEYDKTHHTFTRVAIPLWPGASGSMAYAVSENGKVVGQEISNESSSTFVYDRNSGEKYEMTDYLRYLYGLKLPDNIVPFNTTSHISDNGRVFAGTGNPSAEIPYLIELGEHQIPAVARAVAARQIRGSQEVTVNWTKPLIGQYTLKGYWVYRDSVRMNAEMLSSTDLSFTDQNVGAGVYTYAVQAVYENGVEAEYAFAAPIRVTASNGCLPVQGIYSSILYNRTVNLYWDLPSDKVMVPASAKKPAAKGYQSLGLDVVNAFDLKNSNASAGVRIGNYIYAVAFQSDLVTIFNAETGALENTVAVEGFKGAYDLTSHGYSIYAVSNDYVVRELFVDPEEPLNIEMGPFWSAKVGKLTHIAYVENPDGEDYLALGAYNNILFYSVNTTGGNDTLPGSEKFNFKAYSIGGSEAHDGKLYVANQASLGGNEVDIFDLATGKKLYTENLSALPQVASVAENQGIIVSGLTKTELEDGMVMLQCLVQPRSLFSTNYLIDMELESWPETTGYNIYRDGTKINETPVRARRYSDVVYEAGKYEYTIEYVSNTCTSNSADAGVSEQVEIYSIGECEKPGAVKATEANGQVIVTWTRPSNTSGLVGFNIYRNREQKVDLVRDERWLDADKLEKGNEYVYRVEAFYNNSCVASDSVTIRPDFEGRAMPPSMLSWTANHNVDDTYDVGLSWELPYFEEPMAHGYCGAPADYITPSGVSTVFALIGWDTSSILFFEDMYLVGMEYIIGTTSLTSLDAVVYIDNKIVHQEPLVRYQADQNWNKVLFNKVFSTKYATELAVGYIASFDPNNLTGNVVVFDAGPGKRAFSDILSFDGKTSTTLAAAGIDANLCINALIVRRRDLEAAAMAPDPAAYLQEKMVRTEMPWQVASSSVLTDAPKTTSAGIKLIGFNVYREDEKLNKNLLTGYSFRDENVRSDRDEIRYAVGAQYEGAEEKLADCYVDLTETGVEEGETFGMYIYPNPVGDNLHVKGEYRTLFITDLAGKRVGNATENAGTVSMSALQSGVYLLHFTLLDGRNVVVKVVKR